MAGNPSPFEYADEPMEARWPVRGNLRVLRHVVRVRVRHQSSNTAGPLANLPTQPRETMSMSTEGRGRLRHTPASARAVDPRSRGSRDRRSAGPPSWASEYGLSKITADGNARQAARSPETDVYSSSPTSEPGRRYSRLLRSRMGCPTPPALCLPFGRRKISSKNAVV